MCLFSAGGHFRRETEACRSVGFPAAFRAGLFVVLVVVVVSVTGDIDKMIIMTGLSPVNPLITTDQDTNQNNNKRVNLWPYIVIIVSTDLLSMVPLIILNPSPSTSSSSWVSSIRCSLSCWAELWLIESGACTDKHG